MIEKLFAEKERENMEKGCIEIKKTGITKLGTDAIVNAANNALLEGGGVCGAIFKEAGAVDLARACNRLGGCKTGNAVITPGFKLPAKYIIHAVGPIWNGGNQNEPKLLYSAYKQALEYVVTDGLGQPAKSDKIQIAGETGTVQLENGNYIVEFCGYFPANAPQYSIIVSIHKDGLPASGGLMAGDVFKQITEYIFIYNKYFNSK